MSLNFGFPNTKEYDAVLENKMLALLNPYHLTNIRVENETPFIQAVIKGDIAGAKFFLDQRESILDQKLLANSCTITSQQPISAAQIAAQRVDIKMLELLKQYNAEIGSSLLLFALALGDQPKALPDLFKLLSAEVQKELLKDYSIQLFCLFAAAASSNVTNLTAAMALFSPRLPDLLLTIRDFPVDNLLSYAMKYCSSPIVNEVMDMYARTFPKRIGEVTPENRRSMFIQKFKLEDDTDMLMLAARSGNIARLNYVVSEMNKADNRDSPVLKESRLERNLLRENVICYALRSENPQMLERVLQLFPSLCRPLAEPNVIEEANEASEEMRLVIWKECVKRKIEDNYHKYIGKPPVENEPPVFEMADEPQQTPEIVVHGHLREGSEPVTMTLEELFQPAGMVELTQTLQPAGTTSPLSDWHTDFLKAAGRYLGVIPPNATPVDMAALLTQVREKLEQIVLKNPLPHAAAHPAVPSNSEVPAIDPLQRVEQELDVAASMLLLQDTPPTLTFSNPPPLPAPALQQRAKKKERSKPKRKPA